MTTLTDHGRKWALRRVSAITSLEELELRIGEFSDLVLSDPEVSAAILKCRQRLMKHAGRRK